MKVIPFSTFFVPSIEIPRWFSRLICYPNFELDLRLSRHLRKSSVCDDFPFGFRNQHFEILMSFLENLVNVYVLHGRWKLHSASLLWTWLTGETVPASWHSQTSACLAVRLRWFCLLSWCRKEGLNQLRKIKLVQLRFCRKAVEWLCSWVYVLVCVCVSQ